MALVYKNGKWVVEATQDQNTTTSASPTAELLSSAKPQETDPGFDLGQAIGNLFKRPDNKPIDVGQFLKDLGTSIVEGTKKAGLTLAELSAAGDPGFNLLAGQEESKKIVEDVGRQQTELAKTKEERQKTQSPVEKFLGEAAEFVTPTLVTVPVAGGGALGVGGLTGLKALLAKSGIAGVDFLAQSQLIFNPSEHPEGKETEARLNDGLASFSIGATFPPLAAVAKFALRPMVNATKSLTDGVIQKLSTKFVEDTFKTVRNPADIVLTRDFEKVSSEDFFKYLRGGEVSEGVKKFFSSPEWVEIAKKYGANPDNYPEFLYAFKPAPVEGAIEQKGVLGLLNAPFGDFKADVTDILLKAADSRARANVEGQKEALEQLKLLLDTYKERGYEYKIKPEEVVKLVDDLANHQRAVDDTFREIAMLESKQNLIKVLQSADLYNGLVLLKRISSLLGNKLVDSERILRSYDKAQKKMGIAQPWDTLTEGLREIGINISDPADLIDFAKALPTKAELNKKVVEPPPFDLEAKLDGVFKLPSTTNKEQPYAVARNVLEIVKQGATPEVKADVNKAVSTLNQISKPTIENPAIDAVLPRLDENYWFKTTGDKFREWVMRNVPVLIDERSKIIGKYGRDGQRLVTVAQNVYLRTQQLLSDFQDLAQEWGLPRLTADEWKNVASSIEKKSVPLTPEIGEISAKLSQWLSKVADDLGIQKRENYFPHFLNDEGREFLLTKKADDPIFKKMAEERGITVQKLLHYLTTSTKKAPFEYPRNLPDLPEKYLLPPDQRIMAYMSQTARRMAEREHFGINSDKLNNIVDSIILKSSNAKSTARELDEFIDKFTGRWRQEENALSFIPRYLGKIPYFNVNWLTGLLNLTQGANASYLQFGIGSEADVISVLWKSKEGAHLLKRAGVTDNDYWYKDIVQNEGKLGTLMDKWMKVNLMKGGENLNYKEVALAARKQLLHAFDMVRKNTDNDKVLKEFLPQFRRYSMYIDPNKLVRDIQKGSMSDDELMFGIADTIRRTLFSNIPGSRPSWAISPWGQPVYALKHFMLHQTALLAHAPIHRQLVYFTLIAPPLGVSSIVLRHIIYGRELPEDGFDWYKQSLLLSGSYLDLYDAVRNPYSLGQTVAGGYSPVLDLLQGKLGRGAVELSPVPMKDSLARFLFPPKTEKKPKPGEFKPLEAGDKNFEPKFKPIK